MLTILPISVLDDTYTYLCFSGIDAFVVDPGEATPILDEMESKNLTLRMILNTHHHVDHTGGNRELKLKTEAIVIGGDPRIPGVERIVSDTEIIDLGFCRMTVIATPGHTRHCLCFHVPRSPLNEHDILFTGDTLFVGGCGRLFEGTPLQLRESFDKLLALPESTLIYAGHEYAEENYRFAASIEPDNESVRRRLEEVIAIRKQGKPSVPSVLGHEKQTNPFLRLSSKRIRSALGLINEDDTGVLARLREMKNGA